MLKTAIDAEQYTVLSGLVSGAKGKWVFHCLLFALTALYCTFPLFLNGTLPNGHDTMFHLFQSDQFYRSLSDGVIVPRWAPGSNGGYGSANFIFYSPLSYYLVSAVHVVVPSLVQSMILVIWLGFFLSGVTMYSTVKETTGCALPVLPAMLYQVMPFHVIDLYWRFSFAELVAFAWFPIVIMFAHKILAEGYNRKAIAGLSVSYALTIITHLVSALILSIVLLAYLTYYYLSEKNEKRLMVVIMSIFVGICLSAYFVVPVIYEKHNVQLGYITSYSYLNFNNNFLFVKNNIAKVYDKYFFLALHIITIIETALFLVLVNLKRFLLTIHGILFLVALFLVLPLSSFIWVYVPGFATLQFPWRWIIVMEITLCLLCGAVFADKVRIGDLFTAPERIMVYGILILLALASSTIFQFRAIDENSLKSIIDPEKVTQHKELAKEYTPIWAHDLERQLGNVQGKKVSVLSGVGSAKVTSWKSEDRTIELKALTPVLLEVSTFYYPGWKAEIDRMTVPVGIRKTSGTMLVAVPKGEHRLEMKFTDTPLRLYAKYATLVSSLLLLIFVSASIVRTTGTSASVIENG